MDTKKISIRLFYTIAVFQGMVFYGSISTLYRKALGLTMFDITLIESISLITMIILEIPWGYIADKIGYKKTIIICNIFFFISKIIFWKADDFNFFLIERLMLSVVLAGLSGCDSSYLYLITGKKDSQKVFGIYEAMSTIGLIGSSIVFSMLIQDDYKLAAFLTVISYGIAMILSLFFTEVRAETTNSMQFEKQLKEIIYSFKKEKQFILFLIAASLLAESNQMITVFANQLQYLRSGIEPKYMGYIYILVSISGLLAAFSYRLTTWLGEITAIRILFCTAGSVCIIMAFFTNPIISILGIVILRVAASLFIPIRMDIQNRQITISNRATMLSIYSSIMSIIAVSTNLIFGKISDIDVRYAMITGAVFCYIGLIFYSIWQFKKRTMNQDEKRKININ